MTVQNLLKLLGALVSGRRRDEEGPFGVFLTPGAADINRARQAHLASLKLDLRGKKVLEVGAGIGLHTPFFLERGCEVTVTDGRPENVAEIARRLPQVRTDVVDLEQDVSLARLGRFDIVYCYGLLYHLGKPERALARLTEVCDGLLLLETAVSLGIHDELILVIPADITHDAVAQVRWVRDLRTLGALRREFQAVQQASTMAS